jgi:hypothetical protein
MRCDFAAVVQSTIAGKRRYAELLLRLMKAWGCQALQPLPWVNARSSLKQCRSSCLILAVPVHHDFCSHRTCCVLKCVLSVLPRQYILACNIICCIPRARHPKYFISPRLVVFSGVHGHDHPEASIIGTWMDMAECGQSYGCIEVMTCHIGLEIHGKKALCRRSNNHIELDLDGG